VAREALSFFRAGVMIIPMRRLRELDYPLTRAAIFIFGILSGCSMATTDKAASDAPVVAALNTWWREATYAPPPVKAGSVTSAHTITIKGRVHNVPRHVQTQKEYEDEAEDARYADRRRSLVLGFSVTGHRVTVITNLSRNSTDIRNPIDIRDAQEICHDLGAFVWANANRHFGLESIKVTGANGELLSSRIGLSGKVQ
jgi:hypothetical protein